MVVYVIIGLSVWYYVSLRPLLYSSNIELMFWV